MDTTYYPYAVLSCVAFLIIYKYISPLCSKYLSEGYPNLSRAKQIEWNTRTNSSVHALLVSVICLYVLVFDDDVNNNPVWADSPIVCYACAIVVGYMVADIIIMLLHYKELGEIFYIFHHGVSIYAYYFVMTYGALPWFANFRLIAEFSTPFVNKRWFLDVLLYPKDSTLFMLNGLTLSVTYFLVRVATIPPYWLKVYSIYGTEPCVQLGRIWYVLLSSCIILDAINLYWFAKVCRGAKKMVVNAAEKSQNAASSKKVS